MPLLILKLTNPDKWDKLTLIIRGAHADDERNIVESEVSTMFHFDGETAKNVFYQLAMVMHDTPDNDGPQTLILSNVEYKFPRPYWEALYNVLFQWVQSMSLALTENTRWNEQL